MRLILNFVEVYPHFTNENYKDKEAPEAHALRGYRLL